MYCKPSLTLWPKYLSFYHVMKNWHFHYFFDRQILLFCLPCEFINDQSYEEVYICQWNKLSILFNIESSHCTSNKFQHKSGVQSSCNFCSLGVFSRFFLHPLHLHQPHLVCTFLFWLTNWLTEVKSARWLYTVSVTQAIFS